MRNRSGPGFWCCGLSCRLAVYLVAGLWTYLSYYVIMYPVFFLIFGALSPRAVPAKILVGGRAVFVVGKSFSCWM